MTARRAAAQAKTGRFADQQKRRLWPLVGEAAVVSSLALLVATFVLALWRARWGEPFNYDSDALYYPMLVRGLGRYGTYLSNPHLGWPLGQHMAGYPEGGDNLHWIVLTGLQWLTGSTMTAINVFYVASFASVAATAHVALRIFGLARATAGSLAVLYAFAPYHVARNETHLMLSSYMMIPIAVLFALRLMEGDGLVLMPDSFRIRWNSTRTWLVLAAAGAIASTGSYYFVFAVLLLSAAGLISSLTNHSWRPALAASLVASVSATVFAINLAPSIIDRLRRPDAFVAASREVTDTERFGLRVSQLFLPREHHRIQVLARLTTYTQHRTILPSEAGQQLGAVAAAGLVAALLVVAVRAVGPHSDSRWGSSNVARRLSHLGILAAVCMFVGGIGSLGYVASVLGLRPIRAWNRISIVIAFCAVAAAGIIVDAGIRRLANRLPHRTRFIALTLPLVVLGIGLADQTSGGDRPSYASIHQRFTSDQAFFTTVAKDLPPSTAVFELPHVSFPERSQLGTGPYDQARGFLFQPELAWSFGFLRGAHPDWAATLDHLPAEQWLTTVIAVGFRALIIDRSGYPDNAAALEHDLAKTLGSPAATSANNRYSFYPLVDFSRRTYARLGNNALAITRQHALHDAPNPTEGRPNVLERAAP